MMGCFEIITGLKGCSRFHLGHCPVWEQFGLGAGGYRCHVGSLTVQQVEQRCGVLLSCHTQTIGRQGVRDGPLARPAWVRVPRAARILCRVKRDKALCHWSDLCLWVCVGRAALKARDLLCKPKRHPSVRRHRFNSFVLWIKMTCFDWFACFLQFACRCLGFAYFTEGSAEVSVHHAADVSMKVGQDNTPGVLLHLHGHWTLCCVCHGSFATKGFDNSFKTSSTFTHLYLKQQ